MQIISYMLLILNQDYVLSYISMGWSCVYLSGPLQVRWEGSGSLRRWQGHGLKQALDGRLNRQQCSVKSLQALLWGCLTAELTPGMKDTPCVHHLKETNILH